MTQDSGAQRAGGAVFDGRRARIAVAVLLIAVVIVGIRGANPSIGRRGPWHAHGTLLGIALELVLAALFIAVTRRAARAEQQAQPAARLRGWLRAVLIIAMVVVLGAILVPLLAGVHPARPFRPPRARIAGRPPAQAQHQAASSGSIELVIIYALLALALLAVVIGCVIAVARRRQPPRPPQADPLLDAGQQSELGRAVESGQAALRAVDDARAAIIACYVAMERSLAAAGAPREAAETPDELLARAAADGIVHGQAAGTLTALFYEARFSSHPLPPARKQAALDALAALAGQLSVAATRAAVP
jgi:Domain of unknown function (DUF4129)